MEKLLITGIVGVVLLTIGVLFWVAKQLSTFKWHHLAKPPEGSSNVSTPDVSTPDTDALSKVRQFMQLNQWNGWLFLLVLVTGGILIAWSALAAYRYFLPEPASEHGVGIDRTFWWTAAITGFTFVLTEVLLFYFSFRYRHTPTRQAHFYPNNNRLELLWTAVPTLVFITMFYLGLDAWEKITSPAPEDAVVVGVMGQQFSWMIRYPGPDGKLGKYDYHQVDAVNDYGLDLQDPASFDDFTPVQIHIPKGKPVVFKLSAKDVIHDAYLPHFRMKMDAVPGMPTSYHFVARFTTEEMRERLNNPEFNYELACAELCGRGHFVMRYVVVVEDEKAFEQWYQQQPSWLSRHPEYLSRIPANLRKVAQQQFYPTALPGSL